MPLKENLMKRMIIREVANERWVREYWSAGVLYGKVTVTNRLKVSDYRKAMINIL